jgi:hypothetical protein|tara:strand:- start:900 stop:1229 length:330 start_codon:yes stop_codon:yes gene_type:complete
MNNNNRKQAAEKLATDAYTVALGSKIVVLEVDILREDTEETVVLKFPSGITVTVTETPMDDVVRWVDDHYLDPTWNVQSDLLVSSHNPDGIGWIFGPPIPVPNQFKKEG